MPIEKIDMERFLELAASHPVVDVRSPGEFSHAHFPGSLSVPLFTDEQRAVIGTTYVQQSRSAAVDLGLSYFSERMKTIREEVTALTPIGKDNKNQAPPRKLLVHCWRGGMRSEAVAWLLSLYGFHIYLLKGGYKAFRKWALSQFSHQYPLRVLGGFTGSGKTPLLKELKRSGNTVIDLEGLAQHKGSAFGALGEKPQPGTEMFENRLALELWKSRNAPEIWLEDESVHIGTVGVPKIFWQQMRNSPLYFIDIPFAERLDYVVSTYGCFDSQSLTACILKIQKRLGGLNTTNAIRFLSERNYKEAFSILLKYYDKMYSESLEKRENLLSILNKVTCNKVEKSNALQFKKI